MSKLIFLIPLLTVLLPISEARAEPVDRFFTPPTARTDGSALKPEEIAGYNAYLDGVKIESESGGKYTLPGDATSVTFEATLGNHELTFHTYDMDGRESELSSVAYIKVGSPPNPIIHMGETTTVITININP